MFKAAASSTFRTFNLSCLVLFGVVLSGFSFNDPYDADEALLGALKNARMQNWVGFQLDLMKSRYAGRSDDLEFVEAAYANTSALRAELLKKIPSSSSRYGEAQYQVAQNLRSAAERRPFLENAYNNLKSKKGKEELVSQVQRVFLACLVEVRDIPTALKVIKEGGNTDKRYLEYQSARLQLMIADDELDTKGSLEPKTKSMVEGVVAGLTKGELFWQADMMAMLGYCEMAHAYVLLEKPKDAIKTLSSAFAQIKGYDKEFEGEQSIYSPQIATIYYLARSYALIAKQVKSGKVKPPKVRVREGGKAVTKQLSKEEGVKLYLNKAFNIMQKDLQTTRYRKSRYSGQALRDLEGIRAMMKAEGMKVPDPGAEQARSVAEDKAYEFYKEKKYKEAVEQFLLAAKGLTTGEDYRNILFFTSASYCYLGEFDKAKEFAFKCVKYFNKDSRAWEAVHNVGIKAKLASHKLKKEEKPEDAKKLRRLSSEMYMKIANDNETYPRIASVLWQTALDKWGEAGALSTQKNELAKKLETLKNTNPASPEIKVMKAELDKIVAEIKTEYTEAIPFFQKLIDNYANSEYGITSIYRIAWIHYINDDKEKAIEYFLRFCEKSSTVTADYLDAKYVAADLLFRSGDMDQAETLFKDVIKQSEPGQVDTSIASVARRVKRFRTGSKALLPWIYDRKGEELLDQAQAMLDQNDELEGLIAEYEVAINKNKEEKKAVVKLPVPVPPAVPKTAPKSFTPGKLPDNFAFKTFINRLAISVDMIRALPDDIVISFKDNLLWVTQNHDTVGCLDGKGFEVTIKGNQVMWDSQKVACYRDGKLVCIYDPETLQSRVAAEGEAPAEIELPGQTQDIPAQELDLRLRFLQKQFDANKNRFENTRKDGLSLQEKGLEGMQAFLEEFPKDKVFSPTILLRIATIYVSLEQWVQAEEFISKLQKRFPKSPEADKSPIYLFRILMNAYEKELDPEKKKALLERAQSQATKIAGSITKQSKGNVNLLAFKLFKSDGKGGSTNLSPELANAAIEEILRRGSDEKHADFPRFSRLREKALLYKAMVLDSQKDYAKGIAQVDTLLTENPKSAYFFKAMTLKAQMQRKTKKYNEAKKTIGEVVTKASVVRDRFKKEYWLGILEFGRIYASVDSKTSQKAAKTPLEQCIEGIKTTEEELQSIREGAYFELFRVHKQLGDNQKAITLQNEYLRTYPDGAYRMEFSKVK